VVSSAYEDKEIKAQRLSEASHTLVLLLQASVFGGGRFHSGHRRLPAMMNDGNDSTIDSGTVKDGV
jgi:hypothetical protein